MFWGLLTIREFNFRFTNSVAYYEILTLDVPKLPSFDDDGDGEQSHEIDSESIRKNKEALEKAKLKKIITGGQE